MSDVDADLPADDAQQELENALEYLRFLGTSPLAEQHTSDALAWVATGVDDNTFNGVIQTQLTPESADAVIADTVARFRAINVPALWYVRETSRPTDLDRRLLAQGCRELSGGVSMIGDLTQMTLPDALLPGLTIERVRSADTLDAWCSVYAPDDPLRRALAFSLGLDEQRPLQYFLARLDGAPVGTASIFLGSRTAGLYDVEVIPSVRRRGIGTAVVSAALRNARHAGCQTAVLGPTPESQRMYQRLGFRLYRNTYRYFAL